MIAVQVLVAGASVVVILVTLMALLMGPVQPEENDDEPQPIQKQ